MLVESIEIKISKKDAMKHILKKTPLVSRIEQFNKKPKNIHIEYIEFKVLSYEIISKHKGQKLFRHEVKKQNITMLVNTYNGYSESIDIIPATVKRYIAKSCIKKSKVDEMYIIEEVKTQIIYFLGNNLKYESLDRLGIQNIKLIQIKSIYKPYWVSDFNGKKIYIDA
ncbi:hypothetical protein CHF27_000235 [Romboutsia maritimum]|uniref:Uncharacterized protein n=1 Tax=Romboutsia maritimum TaxID=2020948 RepID=A0A371IW06_9FIRM|nr:hypothetical protein [Romboutsia maritimum]RDY24663.1 hypothetical protein CHF27_000235 [Romboutsia maritimum]